jgi:hypothetical protein
MPSPEKARAERLNMMEREVIGLAEVVKVGFPATEDEDGDADPDSLTFNLRDASAPVADVCGLIAADPGVARALKARKKATFMFHFLASDVVVSHKVGADGLKDTPWSMLDGWKQSAANGMGRATAVITTAGGPRHQTWNLILTPTGGWATANNKAGMPKVHKTLSTAAAAVTAREAAKAETRADAVPNGNEGNPQPQR